METTSPATVQNEQSVAPTISSENTTQPQPPPTVVPTTAQENTTPQTAQENTTSQTAQQIINLETPTTPNVPISSPAQNIVVNNSTLEAPSTSAPTVDKMEIEETNTHSIPASKPQENISTISVSNSMTAVATPTVPQSTVSIDAPTTIISEKSTVISNSVTEGAELQQFMEKRKQIIERTKENVNRVKQELEQLQNEQLPEWTAKVASLQNLKNLRMQTAQLMKQYQMEVLEQLYHAELKQAESDFADDVSQWKSVFTQVLQERLEKLEKQIQLPSKEDEPEYIPSTSVELEWAKKMDEMEAVREAMINGKNRAENHWYYRPNRRNIRKFTKDELKNASYENLYKLKQKAMEWVQQNIKKETPQAPIVQQESIHVTLKNQEITEDLSNLLNTNTANGNDVANPASR